ncbi:maleate cis-trans isomerase [Homoserinimonas sp. OAct 916]|uniref:maleate cis-trans isomerase family protein n=1 Tax=Homoserinimonas sp. OAct 916 TaxID=2211450 RepID=UPI000DBE4E86|nr:maleate cis-trans isomerase [Homoserinimonas sp. OAct 916]
MPLPLNIGLLYPGLGADDDFPYLESAHPGLLSLPLVRTAGGDVAHLVDELLAVGGTENLLAGVSELQSLHPDAVMWACTSGSFVYGWAGAHVQADEVAEAAGVPASSTSIAFAEACRALNVTSVAVAASYPDDLAQHFRRFLDDCGFGIEVLSFTSNDIATAGEVGLLGRDEVIAMAKAADHPDAQAVLIPDTAMHSLRWIDDLERELGKIVLTANQVTVWEGLRIAGRPLKLDGLGTLFR